MKLKKLKNRLLNNWGLKLISLVLAFLLWFLVVQIGDPKDSQDMGRITVKLVNTELLDAENKVYEILDDTDTVRVTVYAQRSVLQNLRSSDITAEADVSRLTDINTIPITFTSANSNVTDIRGSHDVVKLNVEDRKSKYVTLVSSTTGEVADGYMISSVSTDQNRIEVTGPQSLVDQVKNAGVVIDVTDATGNLTANVDITLYDENGDAVTGENLVTNVSYVRETVEVLAVKEVPVELQVMGEPASGYMATGVVECDLSTVQIAGTTYALSRVSQITIPAEELDITGANGTVTKEIDIREYLPDSVKLADSSFSGKVTATVFVEPIVKKELELDQSQLQISGLPEELQAELIMEDDEVYTLEIEGLQEDVDAVSEDSLTGTLDIAAWMEDEGLETLSIGTHYIPVTFALGEDVTVTSAPAIGIRITSAD